MRGMGALCYRQEAIALLTFLFMQHVTPDNTTPLGRSHTPFLIAFASRSSFCLSGTVILEPRHLISFYTTADAVECI
jgi:hypothetical protein